MIKKVNILQQNVNSIEGMFFSQFHKVNVDLVTLNTRANHQRKDLRVIENQQMVLMEQMSELVQRMLKLEEAYTKKDKCIHMLEVTIEHCKVTVDMYADIIETLQTKVCCYNEYVTKTTSGSGVRKESLELEYVSESSKEEFRTPPPDLMMVIDGHTLRGMFPVTINLTMMSNNMCRRYSYVLLCSNEGYLI